MAEYSSLSDIADVGVPTALDLVWAGGLVASVTEWIDGRPLDAECPTSSAALAQALTRILARAHAAGWTHGDVKPSNILVTESGRIVVVDWELATRHGSDAAPGSLGWAPPEAWEPGYTSAPANDVYSAAVVVWELEHHRRAFNGATPDVVRQQESFRFESACDSDPAIAALFAAARDRRTPGALDPRAIVDSANCDVVRAISSRAQRTSAPPTIARQLYSIRVTEQRSAVTARTLTTWVDAVAVNCTHSPAASRIDAARARWISACTQVLGLLDPMCRVLVDIDRASDDEIALVDRLRAAIRDNCPASVELIDGVQGDLRAWTPTIGDRHGMIRAALQALGACAEVPGALFRRACDLEISQPEDLRALMRSAIEAGALSWRDGSWFCVDASGVTGGLAPRVSSPELIHCPVSAQDSPLSDVLTAGERAAALAAVATAYRACVRATTVISDGGVFTESDVVRLVDLWMDIGNPAACQVVLVAAGTTCSAPYRLRTLARVLVATHRVAELRGLVGELADTATSPEDLLVLSRVRAVIAESDRDYDSAYAALRAVRAVRRDAPWTARLEYTVTLSNVTRRMGRVSRARALLHGLEGLALRFGAVRLLLASRINALLTTDASRLRTTAESWESVFTGASGWGFGQYASYSAAMGARTWLSAGDPPRAHALLAKWNDVEPRFGRPSGRVAEMMTCGRAALLDYDGDLIALSELLAANTDEPELSARRILLRLELAIESVGTAQSRLRRRRDDAGRVVRTACRVAARQSCTQVRVSRVLTALESKLVAGTGLGPHTLRQMIRSASCDHGQTLRAARALHAANVIGRDLAVAAHAIELAWHGSNVDSEGQRWFVDNAPRVSTARPVGVREWEWAWAHLAADVPVIEGTSEARQRVVDGEASLGSFLRRMPRDANDVCARGMPIASLARIASSAMAVASNRVDLHGLGESGLGLVSQVAQLHLVAPVPSRGREADIERVLRSALRLRSSTSVDEVLAETVSGVLEVCRAERAVALFDLGSGGVRAKVGTARGVTDLPASEAEISHSVLARVRDATGAVVIDDAAAEESLGDRPSVRKYRPRSVMVCPLRTPTRYLGYLYVENRSRPRSFSGADPEMLEGFASQAALALENAALVEDLRTSYRDLSRARSEAVRAESLRALGRMATEVAHDLNNLLTAIMGESQLLLTDPRFREAYLSLRVIERAAQDGAECIRRIQDSTRVRPAAEFEELDVVQLLRDVLEFTRVRCSAKAGRPSSGIRVHYASPARALVRGVPGELREVFTNLVVNAIEAMAEGGDLRVRIECDDADVRISVEDTGCGISPTVLARLFEPFFTTKGEKGNGLGLSIAQGVVRRHGGEIGVESELGRGTTISVRLPRVHTGIELDSAPAVREGSAEGGRKRFLIVDDDASVLRVLEQMLEQAGVEVDAVVGGDAAVAKLEHGQRHYDCVITDLYMPRVSGLDVAACVHRRSPDTPIVVMSGCATTLASEATRERGISQVIRKPFALDAIRRLVGR